MTLQEEIENFYNQKKKKTKPKEVKCPYTKKNCKNWDQNKQLCQRGWCAI